MNTKKIGILTLLVTAVIAVIVIAVVLIIGRVGPEAKTDPGEITEPSGFTEYEEVTPEEIDPPTSDIIGKDIPDVPRYPGSVRTSYTISYNEWYYDEGQIHEEATKTTVNYITSANVDEVVRFYKKELPANGWINIGETHTEDISSLTGKKERAGVEVDIYPDDIYPDHTSILIRTWRY